MEYLLTALTKSEGHYDAWNFSAELEHGVTNKFTAKGEVHLQSIDVKDLLIDAYIPKDEDYGPRLSGVEAEAKYMFLSPAKDWMGLAAAFSLSYDWLDPHSGQDKDTLSAETTLILQKYFMEGQLIWVGNLGLEATYAQRDPIDNLPPGFEWPTDPEMEIEFTGRTGLSYRFAPGWFIGAEVEYQTEFETEVGQERWSWFAGPSLHYASDNWWATFTWFPQISGGGEQFPGQDTHLHLIEKTEEEFRLKVGFEF
jgi:hypothetical protein